MISIKDRAGNIIMAIERIKHEPTYITNKFEFYYDSYDDENRYSNYEFDYVREGVEYMIIYTTSKEEIYMDVIRNEAMVKVENPTIFDQYSIIQNSSRELYLKSYILVLTDIMRKKGSVIRYFAKSKLDTAHIGLEVDNQIRIPMDIPPIINELKEMSY